MLKNLLKNIRSNIDSRVCSYIARLLSPSFDSLDNRIKALSVHTANMAAELEQINKDMDGLGVDIIRLDEQMEGRSDSAMYQTISDLMDRVDDLSRDIVDVRDDMDNLDDSRDAVDEFKQDLISALQGM